MKKTQNQDEKSDKDIHTKITTIMLNQDKVLKGINNMRSSL